MTILDLVFCAAFLFWAAMWALRNRSSVAKEDIGERLLWQLIGLVCAGGGFACLVVAIGTIVERGVP